jgi:hypothetical protein
MPVGVGVTGYERRSPAKSRLVLVRRPNDWTEVTLPFPELDEGS